MSNYDLYNIPMEIRNRGYHRGYSRRPARGQHMGSNYRPDYRNGNYMKYDNTTFLMRCSILFIYNFVIILVIKEL